MCGVAGIFGPVDGSQSVERLLRKLQHRGPDGIGWARAGPVTLGSTRLAIVDPPADSEVLYDESRSLCLVFNGEIYNYRELRDELIGRGHRFGTKTDSEVVVHLVEELGADCVSRLRGMYAFAAVKDDELLLARDRFGIKPLYWTIDQASGAFLFASEVKALLAVVSQAPRLDMQAFADLVAVGHVVGTATLFEGIHTVAPGSTVRVRSDGELHVETKSYVTPVERDPTMSYEDAEERIIWALEDSLRRHLDADVEVGLTLSGGLDSTVLALLAHEVTGEGLRTYTVADHPDHPDVIHAETVAKLIRSDHQTLIISMDQYLDAVPRLVWSEEAPASLFGLPFHLLCEHIAGDLKCCVHGEGADELFGGYVEYLVRDHRSRSFARQLPRLKRLGVAPSKEAVQLMLQLSGATALAEHVEAVLVANLRDPLQRLHLDPVDRSAMSFGLEMRVPYLDDELATLVRTVPAQHLVRWDIGVRKYLLRRLALRRFGGVHGADLLDVVLREKLGAPSAGVLLLSAVDELCEQELPSDYLEQHELGCCFATKRQLLMFEYFALMFMDHRGDLDAVPPVSEFLEARKERAR